MRAWLTAALLAFWCTACADTPPPPAVVYHYHYHIVIPDEGVDEYYDDGFEYDPEQPDVWEHLPGLDL